MEVYGNCGLYDRIDQILSKKNMSRRQLAKAIGIPPTTLQSAFEKKSNLSIERLHKIAKALDVDPGELLGTKWGLTIALDTLQKGQKNGWEDVTEELFNAEKVERKLEKRLEKAYYTLNLTGKRVAVERIEELAQLPQYQNAAGDSTQSAGDEPAE